jgi:hypothetical protein
MAYGLTKSVDLERSTPDRLRRTDDTAFDLAAIWTVEAWVKLEALPASNTEYAIVGKWNVVGSNRSWVVRLQNSAGVLQWQLVTDADGAVGGAAVYRSSTRSLSTDTWYHVAFVADSGSGYIYEDGVSVGASGTVVTPVNGNAELCVGSERVDGTAGWDGEISLVRIWKGEARTQTQIQDNACEVLGSTANLSAEWTLDDTYTDNSGNGFTLTAYGSPTFVTDVPSVCTTAVNTTNFFVMM